MVHAIPDGVQRKSGRNDPGRPVEPDQGGAPVEHQAHHLEGDSFGRAVGESKSQINSSDAHEEQSRSRSRKPIRQRGEKSDRR